MKMKRLVLLIALMIVAHPVQATSDPQKRVVCQAAVDDGTLVAQRGILLRRIHLTTDDLYRPQELLENYGRLARILDAQGVALVLVPIPMRGPMMHMFLDPEDEFQATYDFDEAYANYQQFVEDLRSTGIMTVDALSPIVGFDWGSTEELPVMRNDYHWSPSGARIGAEAVANVIRNHPHYSSLPTMTLRTTESIGEEPRSPLLRHIEELCDTTYPLYDMLSFTTERIGVDASIDLLATDYSPVVLVGTSNSNTRFNLVGSLSEMLETEVDGIVVPGGGKFTSIETYLTSDEFHESKPTFLIWEFPLMQFYLRGAEAALMNGFRRIIPAAHAPCSIADSLAQGSTTVSGTTFDVLSIPAGVNIFGDDYYLVLEVSDRSLVEFATHFIHEGEDAQDDVQVERSTRVVNSGVFTIELSRHLKQRLERVSITVPQGTRGQISSRLCGPGL